MHIAQNKKNEEKLTGTRRGGWDSGTHRGGGARRRSVEGGVRTSRTSGSLLGSWDAARLARELGRVGEAEPGGAGREVGGGEAEPGGVPSGEPEGSRIRRRAAPTWLGRPPRRPDPEERAGSGRRASSGVRDCGEIASGRANFSVNTYRGCILAVS